MRYNIGSTLGKGDTINLSIDFKSDLGLSTQIGSVTIECQNKQLKEKLESCIKREVNKFNKNQK